MGKTFICINILVLSLLMLTGCTEKWPRIIYQNTSYRFDEYNRTIVLDDGCMILLKNNTIKRLITPLPTPLFMGMWNPEIVEIKGRYNYIRRSWVI